MAGDLAIEPLVAWARGCAVAPAGGPDAPVLVREPSRGRYLTLNAAAAAILEGLREGSPHAALRRLRDCEVPTATAAGWLEGTLAAWREAGYDDRQRPAAAGREPGAAVPREPAGVAPILDAVYRPGTSAVRVRCFEPRLAAILASLLEPALSPAAWPTADLAIVHDGASSTYTLLRDGAEAGIEAAPLAAKWAVLRQLATLGRPERRWAALLHAGGVADGQGRAALLAGPSGSGKSTLTAALVASGLGLLADDLVPVDAALWRAWPMPLAMTLKEGSWPTVGRLFPALARTPVVHAGRGPCRYMWPGAGHAADGTQGYATAALLFPTYAEGAPLALQRIDALETIGLLGAAGSSLPRTEEDLRSLVAWAGRVPAYRLRYGDLDAAVAEVRGLLAAAA